MSRSESGRSGSDRVESDSDYPVLQPTSAYRHATPAPPTPSWAELQNLPVQRIIVAEDWHDDDHPDFHRRFAARSYHFASNVLNGPRSQVSDTSTRVLAYPHAQVSSAYAPSLTTSHYTSPSVSSVDTSVGVSVLNRLQRGRLLEVDEDGTLLVPANGSVWQCPYRFLDCAESLGSMEQWDAHCMSHFRNRAELILPRSVQCPFTCSWSYEASSGQEAWRHRQYHVYTQHAAGGSLDTSRKPDSALIQHLWRNEIISDVQAHDLRKYGCVRSTEPYLETESPSRSRRRERRAGSGRERRTG